MPVQFQVVIFAVIAAVMLFMLYNVLGKKVGRQPQEDAKKTSPVTGLAATAHGREQAAPATGADVAVLAAVAGLKARDPNFDPVRFLEGARQAYETIVRGYAAGDRESLKPLLNSAVMTSFEAGMAAREVRGETEEAEFVHPPRADLEHATADGNRAIARVRFLAELRSRVKPAGGGEEILEERRTAENWTFERTLGAADPNWVLARVEPATA